MLLIVSLVHDVDHTLGVGITVVGGVWGTLIIIVDKEIISWTVVKKGSMIFICSLPLWTMVSSMG